MPYAIDLFCGAGGCSEGLIQAGFDILFSSDISEMVERTYRHRHEQLGLIQGDNTWFERSDVRDLTGDIIRDRISKLRVFDDKDVPEIDLMIGGPSCQGFSRAGRRQVNDPRNMLFGEYVRIISEVRPRYIVLENVEGFLDMQFMGYVGITGIKYPDGTVTPDILMSELNAIGYLTLQPKVLNAADYGVPQRRRRVIFIGYRQGERTPSYPQPTTPDPSEQVSIGDAISDLIIDDDIRNERNPVTTRYQTTSQQGRTPNVRTGVPIAVADDATQTCTELTHISEIVVERLRLFRQGESITNLRKRIHDEGIDVSECPTLVRFCSSSLGMGEQDVIELFRRGNVTEKQLDVLLTRKRVRKRLDASKPSPTIVSIPEDYIHPWEARPLNVREMARCQSFDDSFEFLGKRVTGGLKRRVEIPQCTQVGNAVPPLLAKAIALEIKNVL